MAKTTYSSKNADKNTTKKRKNKKKKIFSRVLVAILIVLALVFSVVAGAVVGFVDNSMDLIAEEYNLDFTSIIYYVDSQTNQPKELDRVHRTENRVWVDIEDMTEHLPNAFIAIEDERFREHSGVDIKRTFGAFIQWVMGKDSYGGSTITQQLVKNITGDKDRSPIRKVQEIIRAMNLEKKMSKDQIIEMYMNTIYFGDGYYGIGAASKGYFKKEPIDLTLDELTLLAGIPNAPSVYSLSNSEELARQRQKQVINSMIEHGYLKEEEMNF